MTPISPETRQFINEHQSDDVRNLALQARKYPDVEHTGCYHPNSRTANRNRENPLLERDRRYMVSETSFTGAMFFRNHRPL